MERSDEAEQEEIAQAAEAWHVRLNDPGASAADHSSFLRWRAADARHAAAFKRAAELWADIGPAVEALGRDGWHRALPIRRRPAPVLGAVCGLAAALLLTFGFLAWRDPGWGDRMFADFSTTPGQREAVTLSDGSRLELDADSAVGLAFTSRGRELRLLRGRLWVDAVRDEGRPFRVTSGEASVEVLGTAFSVARLDGGLTAVVQRGLVAVSRAGDKVMLQAGEAADAAAGRPLLVRSAPAVALAWRQGLLVFDGTPLGEVARTLERAGAGPVALIDAAARRAVFTGVFQADRPEAVLAALSPALGLQTTRVPGFGTLIHRGENFAGPR